MTRVPFNRISFKTIILSICLLWSAQSALATTVVPPLDEDMIVGARAIITGKVLQIESAIDEQDRIYTYITVRVTEVIKGQITERKIILKEFGGVVGNRVSVVYGSPQFKRGEKVLLYLGTHNDGSLRTYQLFLGKFSIVRDDATGNRFAVRDTGGENVTVLTMQGQAQGDSTDRMELSSYTNMVQTKLASNLERSQAFEDTYYRNVPVLASPPSFVSSKKQVHSEYTFLGNVRWFQPDSGQVVPYTINPNPAQGAPQVVPDPNDIAAAANAWTGVPGSSLALSYSGNLDNCYTQTGTPAINIVSNNCDGHNQPSSGCAGILAIGGWSGGGNQTRVIGGITFGQITQGFVSFNPWASCYFSDHCNFREIATHELGHALGLAHSADPTATMAPYAHFDGRCASIKQDEINGITFLYPGSGGGPGPLGVVTSTLPGGTTGTPYSQPLTGSGGTLPYIWSIVAGLGTLPTGLSLSAAGTISGTPNTAGTYNFTVRVTDAASATAQKALSIVVVPAGAGPLNSQFVSQTVPTTLQPGQSFNVNLKFLNTGTQTWSGSLFYLASQNPALNQIWGGNAVTLSSFVIAPGQQLDVTFTALAPTTPGTYNFQWQAYKNDGTGFIGQKSTNVAIQVGSAVATDNATFASQTVAASMAMGLSYSVSVAMTNTGTTTWTPGAGYKLASQNPQDNMTWGLNRANLPTSVAPGAQVTFTFNVTAPSTAGAYTFQWQMIKDGTGVFGTASTNVPVSVQRFRDVPLTDPYYAYIEKIAQRGVTAGCGGGNYCPDGIVSREQMATFLERALGVVNIPTPTGQTFTDVAPGRWSYPFVEDFATRGITAGCGGGLFCPDGLVTREQMATFMVRALGHNPGTPALQRFVDVDPSRWSYFFVDDFEQYGSPRGIMTEIIKGCNADGAHFCPDKTLTRAEMAAWLVITFGW